MFMKTSKTINKMMNEPNINIRYQFLQRASLRILLPLLPTLTPPAHAGPEDTSFGTGTLAHEQPGGNYNTAFGFDALFSNTIGIRNTATGVNALYSNFTGTDDTATGLNALYSNINANYNTATGAYSLAFNTGGTQNTANGWSALYTNIDGNYNTATGLDALHKNAHASFNTADGLKALYYNTANSNTAVGYDALLGNTSGSSNTALGTNAGKNLTTGSGNVCIGANVSGVAGESNTTWIKNVYASVASGRAVYVNADNKIGTFSSSRRYKEEIKPMDKASETLFSLKPVTFRYKKEIDPSGSRCFGLIAEQVAAVDSELVTPDREGKPETVRNEAINAMLLNEFLKEHRKVQELETTVAQQQNNFQARIAEQEKEIRALTAGLQKVSARVEMSHPAPQVADIR
jgi:trimeric autotransporter adhesin